MHMGWVIPIMFSLRGEGVSDTSVAQASDLLPCACLADKGDEVVSEKLDPLLAEVGLRYTPLSLVELG